MNEYVCVELVVDRKTYADSGVYKGMQGWICDSRCINESWLVCFPRYGDKPNIATIGIKEKDLTKISSMNASRNEEIEATRNEK